MVLVLIDHSDTQIKKSTFEALSYAAEVAKQTNTTAEGLLLGSVTDNLADLGNYGVTKIHQISNDGLNQLDAQVYAQVVADAVKQLNADVIVFSHNQTGKSVAPLVAAKLKAGLVSGAVALPETSNGFTVKKNVFSGKAFANVEIKSAIKIISLNPNSFHVKQESRTATVESLNINIPSSKIKIKATNKVEGEVPLTEAEIVVSGGRGLKGPENWKIIEDLAHELHAATACSRPVADAGWRPHHEHVGQTGVAIRPNLYIAIGISGAIQHLAGVNGSKTIVVINNDKEAPFFKSADYGVIGDAFTIVPKLTEAVKKFKANQN
jgi:electron transfer flavoprotein alpha subunit